MPGTCRESKIGTFIYVMIATYFFKVKLTYIDEKTAIGSDTSLCFPYTGFSNSLFLFISPNNSSLT